MHKREGLIKLSRRIIVCTLVIVCLITLVCPFFISYAAPTKEKVKVGYYENEIFQEGAKEGAKKSGYAYEYYRKLSEYTGWDYEYVYGDFDELYTMLINGDIDFLAGLAKTNERENIIGYPDVAMGNENYMLVKHKSDKQITSDPASISGKKIGVLKSAIEGLLKDYLNYVKVNSEVVVYDNYDDLFNAFDNKQIDILAAEGDGAYKRADAEVIGIFGKRDYYLCVNKARGDLLAELNDTILQIQNDEPSFFTSLQNKYYASGFSGRIYSDQENNWVNSHSELKVGYLNNYLPYSDTDKEGNVTGMVKDIVPAILEELGLSNLNVVYTGYSNYDDMVSDVVSGKIDVVFPVGGGLYYSEENGIYQSSPVVSSSTDIVYKGEYNEDNIKSFAVNENNRMQYYYIITYYPDAEIKKYASIDDCLNAVNNGEVSATTLNGLRANDIIKNKHYNNLSLKQLSNVDERSFGIVIGNEGLLRLFNRGIALIGNDYIQKVAYSYAGELYSYGIGDIFEEYLTEFLVIIIIAILIFVFLIVRDLRRQRKASKLKSDFLSNMSHEIRTPITAILGMNEMIQLESDDENILRYSGNIEKASNNLLGIINDILDISKIESGKLELYEEEYSLTDMLLEICAMIEQSASTKGLRFEAIIDEKLPTGLYGDVKKLRQVVMNLLTNAVKYTREGHVIYRVSLISIEEDKAVIKMSVEDTGIGIKSSDKKNLYKEFDRLDLDKNSNIEGTGLGLAISQKMLSMMDSSIELNSTYGKGSEFYFTIVQKICDKEPIGDFDIRREEVVNIYRKDKESFLKARGAKILVVDDTPMNLSVICGLLKHSGIIIHTAESGRECIEMVGNENYDLIILDQRMPEMDGMETLSELKNKYPSVMSTLPVIALTANVLSGNKEIMLKAGFSDYLTKPIKRETLEKTLSKYLKDKESEVLVELREAGLDVDSGIEYCGDEEDYLYAISLYEQSGRKRCEEIEKYLEEDNLKDLGTLIHSIKSTSASIGANELAAKALELEKACDNAEKEYIEANIMEFIEDYTQLVKKLGEMDYGEK